MGFGLVTLLHEVVTDRLALKPLGPTLIAWHDYPSAAPLEVVKAWLAKHPRFKLHFTPTSASWLNLVERFFAEITTKRIRRGSYISVNDLEAAIYDYLGQHNTKQKPFTWTKTAEDILTRERRALDKLDEIRGNR